MPAPIRYAHRLIEARRGHFESGEIDYLRPDAKSQVTVEYGDDGKPARVDTVVLSTQHSPEVAHESLRKDVIEKVIRPSLPSELLDDDTIFHVNPTGRFVVGGPMGDAGLTGRKIIVDTYGGMGRHGGGAFSGKDPSKVVAARLRGPLRGQEPGGRRRRAAASAARYAIGVAEPVSIRVDTFGGSPLDLGQLEHLVRKHFDLTPRGIDESLDLRRPIYRASRTTVTSGGRTPASRGSAPTRPRRSGPISRRTRTSTAPPGGPRSLDLGGTSCDITARHEGDIWGRPRGLRTLAGLGACALAQAGAASACDEEVRVLLSRTTRGTTLEVAGRRHHFEPTRQGIRVDGGAPVPRWRAGPNWRASASWRCGVPSRCSPTPAD